ncbi:hypothetical protein NMY22_g11074 [Coprinellus aureogranulatus]|nr:hypothetical protein NMY22_g11074 [Coprinellus aureogranulatus]
MSLAVRHAYTGSRKRLVIAFDVGTMSSGISYSILEPGQMPTIYPVTGFPSHEYAGDDIKVPTVIYYDNQGRPCAIGAETLKEGFEVDAAENGFTRIEWFRLHLFPSLRLSGRTPLSRIAAPPLPPGKTAVKVLSDYMRYLLHRAESHIRRIHGQELWSTVEENCVLVLTHPSAWGEEQYRQMRRAAVLAGWVLDTSEGHASIIFVKESEASLEFCLRSRLQEDGLEGGIVIADLGGTTIDSTTFARGADGKFVELATSTSHFQGAALATARFRHYVEGLLSGTRFSEDVDAIVNCFDEHTKHRFASEVEDYHIQFGADSASELALNIWEGQLTLPGREIAKCFEPSITCIINAIQAQIVAARAEIKWVCFVGGLAASNWVYRRVREQVEALEISVFRPHTHVNNAVSSGAVSHYLNTIVAD